MSCGIERISLGSEVVIWDGTVAVDNALVEEIGGYGEDPTHCVQLKSLRLKPGEVTQFAFLPNTFKEEDSGLGWRVLRKDPAGGLCYSWREPSYGLQPK